MALPPIPLREKVLLWLAHVEERYNGESGLHSTQAGIANATGMARAHVSRTLIPLLDAGWILQEDRRLPGFTRRLVGYRLTPKGKEQVSALGQTLSTVEVPVGREGSQPTPVALREGLAASSVRVTLWDAVAQLSRQGFLDLASGPTSTPGRATFLRELSDASVPAAFVGREQERDAFRAWLEGTSPLYILEGPAGLGKTSFLGHALRTLNPRSHALWVRVSDWLSSRTLVDRLDGLLRSLGRPDPPLPEGPPAAFAAALGPRLKGFPLVVVLDGYHRATDLLRQQAQALVEVARGGTKIKIILAGREVALPPETLRGAFRASLLPLNEAESDAVLANLRVPPAKRGSTIEAAQGNPLFLELLASHEGVNVRHSEVAKFLVRDVVGSLAADQQEMLKWAAAHPAAVGVEFYERLGLGSPAALEALARASLLRRLHDGRYEPHEFVRDALYDAIGFQERRRVHHTLAKMFEARVDTLDGAAHYLHHVVRAGNREEAIRWVFRNRTRILSQAYDRHRHESP